MYVYVVFFDISDIYYNEFETKKIKFKPNKYRSVENMDLISVGLIKRVRIV